MFPSWHFSLSYFFSSAPSPCVCLPAAVWISTLVTEITWLLFLPPFFSSSSCLPRGGMREFLLSPNKKFLSYFIKETKNPKKGPWFPWHWWNLFLSSVSAALVSFGSYDMCDHKPEGLKKWKWAGDATQWSSSCLACTRSRAGTPSQKKKQKHTNKGQQQTPEIF